MEMKFFRELMDVDANGELRALIEEEELMPPSTQMNARYYVGENRAVRRARQQEERRTAKRAKVPA